jgi:hypothetical protein
MPKLLGSKPYPALVDVYKRVRVQNPVSGAFVYKWVYDDPETYRCNFMSLKGHGEEFGAAYTEADSVKLEIDPQDARFVTLAMRFGNLRMANDETQQYYSYVGDRLQSEKHASYYFNIDAMNPQVDNNGRIVCVEVYGRLAQAA